MTDTTSDPGGRIAPATEGPRLTEQVNVLTTAEQRAFLLGSRVVDSTSEGTIVRELIRAAIENFRESYPDQYTKRMEIGRQELARRG